MAAFPSSPQSIAPPGEAERRGDLSGHKHPLERRCMQCFEYTLFLIH